MYETGAELPRRLRPKVWNSWVTFARSGDVLDRQLHDSPHTAGRTPRVPSHGFGVVGDAKTILSRCRFCAPSAMWTPSRWCCDAVLFAPDGAVKRRDELDPKSAIVPLCASAVLRVFITDLYELQSIGTVARRSFEHLYIAGSS